MVFGNDNRNFTSQEDNRENGICDCPCQAEIARLRVEVGALKKILENTGNNHAQQSEANKQGSQIVATQDSCTGSAISAKESEPPDALFNDVVLRHIGSYLSVRDLLDCSLVCKAWYSAASVTLQTRPTYLKEGIDDVPSLIASIRNQPGFPFLGYQWSGYCEENEDMLNFLIQSSHVFRRLHIKFSLSAPSNAAMMTEFLVTYFSQIEMLDMTETHCYIQGPETSEEFRFLRSNMEKLCLPQLKVLILPRVVQDRVAFHTFFRDIISSAPKLQKIEGFTPTFTTAVNTAGKMHTVTRMKLNGCEIAPFINVAWAPPHHLSHLVIDDYVDWRQDTEQQSAIWNAFVAVLVASRETFKCLTMRDLGSQATSFPCLPKLTYFHLDLTPDRCPTTYRLFPENVSTVFPALNTVIVECRDRWWRRPLCNVRQSDLLRLFMWDEPLQSVTSLEIRFPVNADGMEFLETTFPNVIQLSVDWEACYRHYSQQYRGVELWNIWNVKFRLQRLKIHRFNPWANENFGLDSFLTGIPFTVCRKLRCLPSAQLPADLSFYDALRVQPNILNLKQYLQELIISFNCPFTHENLQAMEQDANSLIASSLANVYVIKLMKHLRIRLTYDHRQVYSTSLKKCLAIMEKCATICHEEFPRP